MVVRGTRNVIMLSLLSITYTYLISSLRNITWIRFGNLSITKEDNIYHISGVLVILVDEIIRQGLEINIITKADAEEIRD